MGFFSKKNKGGKKEWPSDNPMFGFEHTANTPYNKLDPRNKRSAIDQTKIHDHEKAAWGRYYDDVDDAARRLQAAKDRNQKDRISRLNELKQAINNPRTSKRDRERYQEMARNLQESIERNRDDM